MPNEIQYILFLHSVNNAQKHKMTYRNRVNWKPKLEEGEKILLKQDITQRK